MLSGGNQQKIVIARWLFAGAELFILDEPTQGIDIAAKIAVYRLINRLTAMGKAVILISSDHDELLAMTDRVGIMSHGRMVTVVRCGIGVQDPISSGHGGMSSGMTRAAGRSPGRSAACLIVALVVGAHDANLPRLRQPEQSRAAGLDRGDHGGRLDDRHLHRRHRSVARLGDRADDGRACFRSQALGVPFWPAVLLALLIGLVLGFDQRRAHRLSAHSLLHHDACGAIGLPRRRLHVQQRLAGHSGLALARADLLRAPGGIPLPLFYVVILYALAFWFLRYTAIGRSIYAVGGNAECGQAVRHRCRAHPAHRLPHRRSAQRLARC